ncbi:hypothetical protein WP12_22020 [Sphingomonas sp. SRS2]|nr:hypothetical protein WP12_22020 [Sphingomonas sp. SRS2]
MIEIVKEQTVNGATLWDATASKYFEWRANIMGYDPAPPASRLISSATDWSAMKKVVEDHIRSHLIDPGSADFRWPYGFVFTTYKPTIFSAKVTGWFICGAVNAKNRMGGYAGETPFVVIQDNDEILFSDMGTIAKISCEKSASNMPPPQPQLHAR